MGSPLPNIPYLTIPFLTRPPLGAIGTEKGFRLASDRFRTSFGFLCEATRAVELVVPLHESHG